MDRVEEGAVVIPRRHHLTPPWPPPPPQPPPSCDNVTANHSPKGHIKAGEQCRCTLEPPGLARPMTYGYGLRNTNINPRRSLAQPNLHDPPYHLPCCCTHKNGNDVRHDEHTDKEDDSDRIKKAPAGQAP